MRYFFQHSCFQAFKLFSIVYRCSFESDQLTAQELDTLEVSYQIFCSSCYAAYFKAEKEQNASNPEVVEEPEDPHEKFLSAINGN